MNVPAQYDPAPVPDFLSGGGEMGQRIRDYGWESTSLGAIEGWPQSLRTCIRIMLSSRQPIWIGWGKELIKFYNDPYQAIVGGKHPWALGKPAAVVWKDIWKDIEPMLAQVMQKGEGTYVESQLLIMERNGYPEETYYTFSYTPIPGDMGGIAGMFCANTDDTDRILSERQLRTITQLGKALGNIHSSEEVISKSVVILQDNPQDFPFALLYRLEQGTARLVGSTDLGETHKNVPEQIDLLSGHDISRLLNKAVTERRYQLLKNLRAVVGDVPGGAWERSPDTAIILPIVQPGQTEPVGFLVVGVNPYRLPDEKYCNFFMLVADQLCTSFMAVNAIIEERKRSEALAEIDRAKTIFFSNISHEFRTPLTLLLGPIEDVLQDPETGSENMSRMHIAYRNGLRMQKLVNTLLEFSSIEAGRLKGSFRAVDIGAFTGDLAGTFRAAIEKAGMALTVDCEEVKEDVYVDTDMWEKIVLNLLSNAFKYSHKGTISVKLEQANQGIRFSVADTGIGIPEQELDKIFDRFHRVQQVGGRSLEGTGIGLAMVKELVKVHGGTITVKSKLGAGSSFIIALPAGKSHLPAEQINQHPHNSLRSNLSYTYTQEALKWIPENGSANGYERYEERMEQPADKKLLSGAAAATVLVADDNADMREYIFRLLSPYYTVIKTADGEDAFEAAASHLPDLIISDIMMPKLDGFGLLKKLKVHPALKYIPLIFLSARAAEEAKIEGLQAGADDYLVKPFSAKELLARVDANIRIAAIRRTAEKNLYNLFMQAPVAIGIFAGADYIIELANEHYVQLVGKQPADLLGKPLFEVVWMEDDRPIRAILEKVRTTGEPVELHHIEIKAKKDDEISTGYFNVIHQPLKETESGVNKIMVVIIDVTDQHMATAEIEKGRQRQQTILEGIADGLLSFDFNWNVIFVNQKVRILSGFDPEKLLGKNIWEVYPESIDSPQYSKMQEVMKHRVAVEYEFFSAIAQKWLEIRIYPTGEGISVFATDISERKRTADILKNTKEQLELTFHNVPAGIYLIDSHGKLLFLNDNAAKLLGYSTAEEAQSQKDVITLREKGKEVFDLFTEDGRPFPPDKTPAAVTLSTRQPAEATIHAVNKTSGQSLWILFKSSPLLDAAGGLSMVLVTSADITLQKTSEVAIRQSEKTFRTLAETLPQMVWMTDEKGTYEYASPQWQLNTGLDPLDGSTWEKLVHPADMPIVVKSWSSSISTGRDYRAELRLKNKNGQYRWHVVEGKPLHDEYGKIIKWIGAFADIHDQKSIEEKLEKLVAERTLALERSNESLQQFAHVASHDLKEPVRKIKIFSERLEAEIKQWPNDKARLYLQKVQSATDRMFAMIDGVLMYSTLNAAQQSTEAVDLNRIMKNIETDVEVTINQKGAAIFCSNLPVIEGAEVLVYQLFYNLLNNSLKFSQPGRKPVISVTSERAENGCVEVSVKDNGIGFDQDHAERIFNPFARLHAKDKYEGTGLGLSLCKKIVERHHGSIEATGKLHQGATFKITLPLKQNQGLV